MTHENCTKEYKELIKTEQQKIRKSGKQRKNLGVRNTRLHKQDES